MFINSFNVFLSGKLCISLSIVNNNIDIQCIFGCTLFFLSVLWIYLASLFWTVNFPLKNQLIVLCGFTCTILVVFLLLLLYYLSLTLDNLIILCLGIGLFGFYLVWDFLCFLGLDVCCFTRIGEFLSILSSNRFSVPFSLSLLFLGPL